MLRLRRGWGRQLAAVTGVGFIIRMVCVLAFKRGVPLVGDGHYYAGAAYLLPKHGFIQPDQFIYSHGRVSTPAADHPPAYIVVLAVWSWLGAQSTLLFQLWSALLGTVTVAVVGLTGRRIAGPRVGLVAAVLAAVYPNFWINEALVMSETLTLLLSAAVIWAAYRLWQRRTTPTAAVLGLAVGGFVLTRAEGLLLPVLLVVPLCLAMKPLGWRSRLRLLLVAEIVVVACLTPWVAFNLSRFNRPELVTTGLGFAMHTANCDTAYRGPLNGYWAYPCGGGVFKGDHSDLDVAQRKLAMTYIGEHVGQLPGVSIARLGRTWGFFRPAQQLRLDQKESGRDLPAAWAGLLMYWAMIPVSVAGALILRRRSVPLVPLLAMPFIVSIAVLLTFGQTRYRAPAEVSLVLLTAVAADSLWSGRHTATGLQEQFARERPRNVDDPETLARLLGVLADSDGGEKPPKLASPKAKSETTSPARSTLG